MTEFQATLLLAQMTRLEEQSQRRDQNGAYLTSLLKEIPGIRPARMYDGCTRNAYHLYMFRYDKEQFAGCRARNSSRP
jgi:perosamine synthetase